MTKAVPSEIETDVLVIGGGIAGIFAAITAQQKGLEVTLVDKGSPGNSGATPFADTFVVFDEERGHKRQDWIDTVAFNGEYLNNRAFLDLLMDQSKARFQDLQDWGVLGEVK
ncbi:MAG: FAD-dependent oxidoreductase, partial [Rhodospirillaceae bacterium]|nr:FAD-dependent oxidoreductase [Rhodospirillaceae bacterium]